MGFFDKLKNGLKKTKSAIMGKIDTLFSSYDKIDDDFYDDLTDVLITADLGVPTADYVTERLREDIKENKIKKSPAVLILSILMLAVAITFMLVKTQPILGQIGVYLCIFGGIGVLVGILLILPRYDTVLTVVTTGYPVEISIDHLKPSEKKELRARLFELLVDEPAEAVAVTVSENEGKKAEEVVEPRTEATFYEVD